MELEHSFSVPVPVERAWDVLLDVERVAPCMPGATLDSVEGDNISGRIKVKVGPIQMTYAGTAKFTERDKAAGVVTLEASGKETRGAGTASANVQATLKPGDAAGSTLVAIHTALNVTGRPAQFGRSLLPEVSGKLIAQFASNLEALIASDNTTATEETATPESDGTAADSSGEAATAAAKPAPAPAMKQEESLNAFKFVVVPILKRVIPVAAVGAAIAVAIRKVTRRKKSS
jgi:carbon monoxide dehydrogenase subunit G